MKNLLEDLVEYLPTKVEGRYFYGGKPEAPDNIIYLMEYSGTSGDIYAAMRQVQINVRNKSEAEAHRIAWALYKEFTLIEPIIRLGDDRFMVVKPHQPPFISDRDKNNRVIYTFNTLITTNHDGGI